MLNFSGADAERREKLKLMLFKSFNRESEVYNISKYQPLGQLGEGIWGDFPFFHLEKKPFASISHLQIVLRNCELVCRLSREVRCTWKGGFDF